MPATCTPRPLVRYATAASPLGTVLVATDRHGLRAVLLGEQEDDLVEDLRTRFPAARFIAAHPALAGVMGRILRLIEVPGAWVGVPLSPVGTPFQRRVWRAVRAIPVGATATYGDVARRIGAPAAARAVARACGANPLAVVVPCHRVVRADRGMGGYRWGLGRKHTLLTRELGV